MKYLLAKSLCFTLQLSAALETLVSYYSTSHNLKSLLLIILDASSKSVLKSDSLFADKCFAAFLFTLRLRSKHNETDKTWARGIHRAHF